MKQTHSFREKSCSSTHSGWLPRKFPGEALELLRESFFHSLTLCKVAAKESSELDDCTCSPASLFHAGFNVQLFSSFFFSPTLLCWSNFPCWAFALKSAFWCDGKVSFFLLLFSRLLEKKCFPWKRIGRKSLIMTWFLLKSSGKWGGNLRKIFPTPKGCLVLGIVIFEEREVFWNFIRMAVSFTFQFL